MMAELMKQQDCRATFHNFELRMKRGWSRQSLTKLHTVVCTLDMEQAIAYLRVSTQRQHRSGLGIDAQRSAIDHFAARESLTVAAEFVEAETGKGADALDRRPQLAAALAAAKAAKCSVVVAKLDRLSRDVAFVAGLMAQRVPSSWPS
jgi:hypothetical protein